MSADVFIDTNVLAYVFDHDTPQKRDIAQRLITEADFVISAQVLSELYVTLTRKLKTPVPVETAKQAIAELSTLPVVATTPTLIASAIDTSIQHQVSYWDALIIEAAVWAGCSTLRTEDLADGALIRGVRIVNPFSDLSPTPGLGLG
ncbi:MAG: PIN domain-containing protein [Propionibacteriaceae bacterium]|nr:PIN domain-containing protein [Propionibacteriaceae bacterium]